MRPRATTLLVGALPPPTGGVASTTAMLMAHFGARLVLLDIAFHGDDRARSAARAYHSLRMTGRLLRLALSHRPAKAILFTSSGASFWEKGAWAFMLRCLGVEPILFPISGNFDWFLERQGSAGAAAARAVLRMCRVVVQSEFWREKFGAWKDADGIVVIPNCVNNDLYSQLKPRDPLKGRRMKFLFVGWITPQKGLLELERAAASLIERGYDFEIILVGPFKKSSPLVRRIWEKEPLLDGRFRFIGELDTDGVKIRSIYAEADAFVFPTHWEGMPGAVLEAMAVGLPIIASSVTSLPDLVDHERNGLLIPARDPYALASAMADLMDGRYDLSEMGRLSREKVIAKFSQSLVVDRYEELVAPAGGGR